MHNCNKSTSLSVRFISHWPVTLWCSRHPCTVKRGYLPLFLICGSSQNKPQHYCQNIGDTYKGGGTMNIAQLECFVNIANTMNFMKTAELMSLTQPAVSRQLQALEQELGVRLLERTTRSVSLTPVGARFLPEAKDILKTWYHSRNWLSSYSMSEQNFLRIGYSDPHGINLISQTLAALKLDHPGLSPRFTIDQTDANLARLERGQLDLIVGIKDYTYQNKDVIFMELLKESFTCVVRNDHPLAEIGNTREIITDDFWPYS